MDGDGSFLISAMRKTTLSQKNKRTHDTGRANRSAGWVSHKNSRSAAIGWVFVEIFCFHCGEADFAMVINMTRPQYGGREHDYNRRPDSVLDTIFVVTGSY